MSHRYAHLTRNEDCLAALDRVLAERPRMGAEGWFATGFVAGWQERGLARPGEVVVSREYLAALEIAAAQKEAGQ